MKWWKRRLVKTDDQMTTPQGAKAVWMQYVGKDDNVVRLVESYQRLLRERSDVIVTERSRLAGLIMKAQGDDGPEPWGRGYYAAAYDMADLVSKGE